eukprot:m.169407 g.169407  ORF g.169407 m.169407 type:complete len:490 (+) comp14495_c0_seq2:491-1960(+)
MQTAEGTTTVLVQATETTALHVQAQVLTQTPQPQHPHHHSQSAHVYHRSRLHTHGAVLPSIPEPAHEPGSTSLELAPLSQDSAPCSATTWNGNPSPSPFNETDQQHPTQRLLHRPQSTPSSEYTQHLGARRREHSLPILHPAHDETILDKRGRFTISQPFIEKAPRLRYHRGRFWVFDELLSEEAETATRSTWRAPMYGKSTSASAMTAVATTGTSTTPPTSAVPSTSTASTAHSSTHTSNSSSISNTAAATIVSSANGMTTSTSGSTSLVGGGGLSATTSSASSTATTPTGPLPTSMSASLPLSLPVTTQGFAKVPGSAVHGTATNAVPNTMTTAATSTIATTHDSGTTSLSTSVNGSGMGSNSVAAPSAVVGSRAGGVLDSTASLSSFSPSLVTAGAQPTAAANAMSPGLTTLHPATLAGLAATIEAVVVRECTKLSLQTSQRLDQLSSTVAQLEGQVQQLQAAQTQQSRNVAAAIRAIATHLESSS